MARTAPPMIGCICETREPAAAAEEGQQHSEAEPRATVLGHRQGVVQAAGRERAAVTIATYVETARQRDLLLEALKGARDTLSWIEESEGPDLSKEIAPISAAIAECEGGAS